MFRRLCYKQLCRLSQLDFINEHFQIECESFRTSIRERGDLKFGIYSEFLFQPSTTKSKLIESNQNKCMVSVYYLPFPKLPKSFVCSWKAEHFLVHVLVLRDFFMNNHGLCG